MSEIAAAERAKLRRPAIWERLTRIDRRIIFWIALVVAVSVYSQSQFWNQPSGGDRANWDYFAQVIARGGVPYRDVVNIKSPLSAYIGAAAITIGRPLGLDDIFAIRITFIFLAALTLALIFLVALDYFKSLCVALLAATVMLTFNSFARFNGGGIQPKTPMVLFGLVTLWAILKDRPLMAGLFGMLSALSWQLNATVYGPNEMRSPANFFSHLGNLLNGFYSNSRWFFYLGLAGIIFAVWQQSKRAFKQGGGYLLESAPAHAVIIAPVVYFAFCMIDIQSGPDLIPLIPFVAVFAALALAGATEQAMNLFARARPSANRVAGLNWASAVIIAFIFYRNVSGAFFFERGFPTLEDQRPAIAEIVSHLEPEDKIFAYGRCEILVLSGLTNASKYFLLDRGKADYLDQVEPGGFDGWLERLKAERPAVVVLDRLEANDKLKRLEEWVGANYQLRINRVFAYYIRKDSAR